jgi:hypothetical protein
LVPSLEVKEQERKTKVQECGERHIVFKIRDLEHCPHLVLECNSTVPKHEVWCDIL